MFLRLGTYLRNDTFICMEDLYLGQRYKYPQLSCVYRDSGSCSSVTTNVILITWDYQRNTHRIGFLSILITYSVDYIGQAPSLSICPSLVTWDKPACLL